jgi:hypothetical protein
MEKHFTMQLVFNKTLIFTTNIRTQSCKKTNKNIYERLPSNKGHVLCPIISQSLQSNEQSIKYSC